MSLLERKNDMNKILCWNCRKKVEYTLKQKNSIAMILGVSIEYIKKYGVCNECGKEIFIPGLDDENEDMIERMYFGNKRKADEVKL